MKKIYLTWALLFAVFSLAAQGKVLLDEDFESGSTGELGDTRYEDPQMPEGWTTQNHYQGQDNRYRWHNLYQSSGAISGTHNAACDGIMFENDQESQTAFGPKEEVLFTPELTLDDTYQLTFLWKSAIGVLNDESYTLQVRVVEQGADVATAPVVLDIADQESLYNSGVTNFPWTGWTPYASAIDLSAWQGKTVRIAFVHKMLEATANVVYIDDVKVEQFTPATTPVAEVTPAAKCYFGDVYLGSKKYSGQLAQPVLYTLENTGLDGLKVTAVESWSPDFSTTIEVGEVNLKRYETYQFQLVYEPTLTGASTDQTVTIKTNGGDITLEVTAVKLPLTGGKTFEGFENGVPPVGWTAADWIATGTALEGDLSASCQGSILNDSAWLVTPQLDFSSTGGTAQTLNFTYYENFISETLEEADSEFKVEFSQDGGKTWTEVFASESSDYNAMRKERVTLPATSSFNCYIRWLYLNPEISSSDYAPELSVVYLDEVVLPPLFGTDLPPVASANPSPADGATGLDNRDVTLGWDRVLFADSYKLYVGTTAAANELVNGQDMGDENTYAFADYLEYATTYYWKVVPVNGNGEASDVPTWTFTTMGDPTITSLPWSESFEGDVFPPAGWRVLSDNGYTEWDVTNVGGYEGEQAVYVSPVYDAAGSVLETPEVELPAEGEQQISFYWGNRVAGSLLVDETGLVENTTTAYDGIDGSYFEIKAEGETEWTPLALLSDKTNPYWVRERILLSDYAGKTVSFRWRYACSDYYKSTGVALDNVRLTAASAEAVSFNMDGWHIGEQNCTWPISSGNIFTLLNDGTQPLTIDSVAFDNACFASTLEVGTQVGAGKGVQFGITFTPAEPDQQIDDQLTVAFTSGYKATFPVSVTVLPADVMYYSFEQDEYGTLTPRDFTTIDVDKRSTIELTMVTYAHRGEPMAFVVLNRDKMDWPAHEAHSGMQSLVAFGANSEKVDVDDWIISNAMTATEQSQFRFFARNYETTSLGSLGFGQSHASVLVATVPYTEDNLEQVFIEEMPAKQLPADDTWSEYTVDLSEYAGKTIYIAVRHTVNDGLAAFFDDFYFEHFSAFNTTPPSGLQSVAGDLQVRLYPNPAADVVCVEGVTEATMTLTSLSGVVMKREAVANQLSVADLAEGLYLLTVETAEGRSTQPIVVKR